MDVQYQHTMFDLKVHASYSYPLYVHDGLWKLYMYIDVKKRIRNTLGVL